MLDLGEIDNLVLEAGTKGLPAHVGSIGLRDVRGAGWNLHTDLQLPAAILRRSALENNDGWMRRFVEHLEGVVLCPHGKTTMAPQLMDRQLRNGAWGMTCATFAHLRCYRRFGIQRILFANQIVGSAEARWVVEELRLDPAFEFYIFVDSISGVELLSHAAQAANLDAPLRLLLEVGWEGARTGVQSLADARALVERIGQVEGVELHGIATFEGIVNGNSDAALEANIEKLFDVVSEVAEQIARDGAFAGIDKVILSAGGSRFYDISAVRLKAIDVGCETLVVLRSGCYITHDARHYEEAFRRMLVRSKLPDVTGRLENALEVWAAVQSRPEPTKAYANLGKRDISYDIDLPNVLHLRPVNAQSDRLGPMPITVQKLSDQHAHLELSPSTPLKFGDHLGFGVSHPCTTFDKWRFLFEVDDDDVVVDAIATFF